jgi:hypothetical protein
MESPQRVDAIRTESSEDEIDQVHEMVSIEEEEPVKGAFHDVDFEQR